MKRGGGGRAWVYVGVWVVAALGVAGALLAGVVGSRGSSAQAEQARRAPEPADAEPRARGGVADGASERRAPSEAPDGAAAAAKKAGAAVWSAAPRPTSGADLGTFDDLNAQTRARLPAWVNPALLWVGQRGEHRYVFAGDQAVAPALDGEGPVWALSAPEANDRDKDGIPDGLDVALGALKAARNGAAYTSGYVALEFPGGDVPRDQGVCTDVIVRAMRNAGFDLQVLLNADIKAHRKRYPMVTRRPNPHIDHRRVRTLLPWFVHHTEARGVDPRAGVSDWLPGDIVFMDTLPKAGPDHVGVVSDELGASGLPKIINNWTDGYSTSAMDLLAFVPVTHRFRLPRDPWGVPAAQRGLGGMVRRAGWRLNTAQRQAVVVTAPSMDASQARLARFEREAGGPWHAVGAEVNARLGSAGLGWGIGLHGKAPEGATLKREGDRRAPLGVFGLGAAFGPERRGPGGAWPWRRATARDWWVDDPKAPTYNTWQTLAKDHDAPWASAEQLKSYPLALVVQHNAPDVTPGRGSAIFVHDHFGARTSSPTLGCTALPNRDLRALIRWLKPNAAPVLVQTVGFVVE